MTIFNVEKRAGFTLPPPSSNSASGFPAHGFTMFFTERKVDQIDQQFAIGIENPIYSRSVLFINGFGRFNYLIHRPYAVMYPLSIPQKAQQFEYLAKAERRVKQERLSDDCSKTSNTMRCDGPRSHRGIFYIGCNAMNTGGAFKS